MTYKEYTFRNPYGTITALILNEEEFNNMKKILNDTLNKFKK